MRLLLVSAFLCLTSGVFAQEYVLSISSGSIPNNGSGDLAVTLDNNGADIQGWSFGVCNDTAFLTCTGAADGSTTATVKDGSPPDFNQVSVFDEGFTAGVVICFTGCATLAPGTGYELNVASYTCTAEGSTSVSFCSTLGSPPVDTVVVVNGASLPAVQNSGDVECIGVPDPEFTFAAGNASAGYNPADGNATASVDISISETDNSGLGAPFPNDTQGFSMGLGHSSEVMATAVNLTLPFDADFGEISIYSEGFTCGVVYSFTGGIVLAFPAALPVLTVDYETGGSMAGNEDGAIASLTWNDGLGSPPVSNVMVVGGASLTPVLSDGSIALSPVVTSDWIRGDVNSDSHVNVADAIWMISELFSGGAATSCIIASDANDDGESNLGDPIYVVQYRFMSGPMPSAPFPDCGQVVGQTPEDCTGSGC